ncbi:AAA family ATPase [Fluviicola taffensis]|uniref:Putative ATPase n=1 Tax=Fluviicola taffensis (strain DSM 16823 / NCIMB 13979 / RW262) TaxID=755732 RepID=F2IJD8_FLUTR|nr:ATP-binding protein [Fluviicola taffensis]AEA46035.1 putative ATPase [Fluviicola taffensis DSM 16823]
MKEIYSPFIFGNTVSTEAYTNREDEAYRLKQNLMGGISTILISPRRWGKSSLVERVISDINQSEKKCKTVLLDLFTVNNEVEFFELFTREVIKATSTKWEDWLADTKSFLSNLVPTVNVGINPHLDFNIKYQHEKVHEFADEILNLPERIAKEKGIRMVICLDEFQNLTNLVGYEPLEKKMRAIWQRQKLVSYCLFGSKRHMLEEIFNNPSKPFYRFGDLMLLPKIKEEAWVKFIQSSFKKTGKQISKEIATIIPRLMKNHSWYVQQLSHYVWNQSRLESVDKQVIQIALTELIFANQPLYQREIEGMSTTQINLLKAIHQREKQLTSTDVMRNYGLGTPRNVSKNRLVLEGRDMILKDETGIYEFLDPAFEIWFRKHYFQTPWEVDFLLNK